MSERPPKMSMIHNHTRPTAFACLILCTISLLYGCSPAYDEAIVKELTDEINTSDKALLMHEEAIIGKRGERSFTYYAVRNTADQELCIEVRFECLGAFRKSCPDEWAFEDSDSMCLAPGDIEVLRSPVKAETGGLFNGKLVVYENGSVYAEKRFTLQAE